MKIKHLFLTAILLVFSVLVVAGPVDPTRALKVAEQFAPQPAKAKRIKSKTTPEQSYEIVYTHRMPNSDRAAFYVVKLDEKGFVIISADDVANPILGYSYTNSWPTSISAEGDTLLPPQVLSYLNDMALQIETAIEKYPNLESSEEWNNVGKKAVRKTPARKSADALPDSVGPLLTTTWGQGQYYNALCPEDAGGEDEHVLTGCAATAMAQIIKYWGQKEKIKTRGIHSYDSQYGNLRVNYDSTSYDFSNMPDALTAESTPEQINAVAKLMYECGVAVNMQYGAMGSSSLNQNVRAAFINFYHFTPDLSIAERTYFSSKDWDKLLQSNIANNKPIYYTGQDLSNGGHAFVCDGYNATGYYHFNFGWGGLADGWYLTNAVSPVGMDFSSNQLVLVGIVPDNTGNVILGQTTGNSVFKVKEPLEFYHLLGHNAYEGTNYINECNNHVLFLSADDTTQLVLDILEHKNQNAIIYDGDGGTKLRSLYAGEENDLSPVVSTNNALHINYSGNLSYSGFRFAISKDEGCRRVSNIVTSVDATTVHLTWRENSNATQWEIEYGEKGFVLGKGTRIITAATQYDLIGLKKFTEYDIYVRSVCSANDYGEWNKVSIFSEAPYWTDIVTKQPNGYSVDDMGNVYISSAEGLAWLISVVNGLNGMESDDYKGRTIFLTQDINLGKYKWTAITPFYGNFDGQNHTIDGLYINELTDAQGLFGETYNSILQNVIFKNCNISGGSYVGTLAGAGENVIIKCCSSEGKIVARNNYAGGIIGTTRGILESGTISVVSMCSSCGTVRSNDSYAGGITSYAYEMYNCFSSADVSVGQYGAAGLTETLGKKMSNCYSIGDVNGFVYNGGLVAGLDYGASVENCYSIGAVTGMGYRVIEGCFDGAVIGTRYGNEKIRYVYGLADFQHHPLIGDFTEDAFSNISVISDTASLVINNTGCTMLTPITIEGKSYLNLLDALNAWVDANNSEGQYLHWVEDTAGVNVGYPIFRQEPIALPKYIITFCNDDGTVLQQDTLELGEMPQYRGEIPTRPSDAQFTYTFTGWSPELSEVVDDQEYTAQYDAIENDPTSMDEVSAETIKPRKVLIDEKVYIIVGETIYSAQSQKIR